MGATSKKRLRDHILGATSKTRFFDRVVASASDMQAGRRAMHPSVRHLPLIAALLFVAAAPASAKVAAKKAAYGAIALQRETGQVGYAYDASTSRAAKTEALNQCAHPRCEVVISFSNSCGALARRPAHGTKGYSSATGATRQEAETKALRKCAAKDCEVAAWACTK